MTDEPAGPEDGNFGTKETIKTEAIDNKAHLQAYWRRNLKYLSILLSIWFVVSYLCAIIFADALNEVTFGGFKLGFWFGHQGSIYVFVVLIWVYVHLMNKLDKEFGLDEGE